MDYYIQNCFKFYVKPIITNYLLHISDIKVLIYEV